MKTIEEIIEYVNFTYETASEEFKLKTCMKIWGNEFARQRLNSVYSRCEDLGLSFAMEIILQEQP